MKTGVRRSSATPPEARTATTTAHGTEPGNVYNLAGRCVQAGGYLGTHKFLQLRVQIDIDAHELLVQAQSHYLKCIKLEDVKAVLAAMTLSREVEPCPELAYTGQSSQNS